MFSTIYSGALLGVQAYLVGVEVDISGGLPAFTMVGSLGSEVRESRERVCVALKNAGWELPPAHVTVNLAPADRKKDGTAYDLPIAVGILKSLDKLPEGATDQTLFLGELGLNGEIKGVRGVLPIVQEAARQGLRQCIVPRENVLEGAVIPGITVRGAGNIRELLTYLLNPVGGEKYLPPVRVQAEQLLADGDPKRSNDFGEVMGQENAKRAATVAAAGFHNLLMLGPPGAGKSMIAKRIPGILPPLTLEESLEVTAVASVAGTLPPGESLVTERPFCHPHHSISQPALIGGGSRPRPGMMSLSHRGVLFLDELPEFQRSVLDSMRQPLEEHQVYIARARETVTYPADFMLVAAMNPCPCGYYPDRNRCRCTGQQVQKYLGKVSGPILDRIDLCVELQPVDILCLSGEGDSQSSAALQEQVMRARRRQEERFHDTRYHFNADVEAADIERFFPLGAVEKELMGQLYHSLKLSVRAYHRIVKTARTIADLEESNEITSEHLLEAACYRPVEEYWKQTQA